MNRLKSGAVVRYKALLFLNGLAVLLVWSTTAFAQAPTPDISGRLDQVDAGVRKLEQQVAELNRLLRLLLPPSPVSDISPVEIRLGNSPIKGSINAKIALVEYSDFQCPFCGQHASASYQQIQEYFVDTGKIKYVFRHLPLEGLHPRARQAAEASECALEQNRFWEFHDRLFQNQKSLGPEDFENHARALNLDIGAFQSCVTSGRVSDTVNEHVAEAKRLGLTGTPAFLIGEIQSDGSVRVTRKIAGAHPFALFQKALEELIQGTTAK